MFKIWVGQRNLIEIFACLSGQYNAKINTFLKMEETDDEQVRKRIENQKKKCFWETSWVDKEFETEGISEDNRQKQNTCKVMATRYHQLK